MLSLFTIDICFWYIYIYIYIYMTDRYIFTLPVHTYGPVTHDYPSLLSLSVPTGYGPVAHETRRGAVCKNVVYYKTDVLPLAPILFNNQMSLYFSTRSMSRSRSRSRSRSCTFRQRISLKWWRRGRIILLQSHMKLHIGFRLSYLGPTFHRGLF